ncbi:hypothetical protein KAW18_07675 [candidate division WOR-3 bacterium]|nr:hypothetical protein [candidate division WOR-3 bacterium]MCK4527237.1 hypothetical protein [candidate division WOR-3 bacterium]
MNQRIRKNHEKWMMGCLFAFLLLLLVPNCKQAQGKRADIALYSDEGADETCIRATENMFKWMGYTVELIKADYINKVGLDSFRLLCVPGGNMYQYALDISLEGKEKIRDFIRGGGGYIGICGGGYFASEKVIWQEQRLPMTPLGIFPGTARGPVDEIVPFPDQEVVKVNIVDSRHPITRTEPDSIWIFYFGGPVFIPNKDAEVNILARHSRGDYSAMVAFNYGRGRVFIIGPHPEFEEDSDRDSVFLPDLPDTVINDGTYRSDDELDDRGSDWGFMRKVALWCLQENAKQVESHNTNSLNNSTKPKKDME